ncbi:Regulator of nonsense transcripts 1-like protein 1 [Colletotrichum musicola]|uniref:Regulator of nonsense transcripts 1-like protein 1 n=1 Tax=Colletotrichum musicola TaxID=2175873 RepID=A0A8H6U8Z6_9PEZI|nr:Regulator of nonsense transcripts 1-like protein 1 [Colletotrichum musicola]
MVHSFLSKEEFERVHREGSEIEMANEEAMYRKFNENPTPRDAWVISAIPVSQSFLSSDLQTNWIVLVNQPSVPDKVFPNEGDDCTMGFKHEFAIAGKKINPGMLKSKRIPNPFENIPDQSHCFSKHSECAAFSVTMEYMADPRTRERYHPLAEIAVHQPDSGGQPVALTWANAVKVVIRVQAHFVTHECEMKALSRLMDHTRGLKPLDKRAVQVFEYLIDFRNQPSTWINLFEELPHMDNPAENPLTPAFLKAAYRKLNIDHLAAYEQLRRMPAGLQLTLGGPGAGKTTLNSLIAALAMSHPVTEVIDAKKTTRRVKVLYLLDVNDPCDDVANRVYRLLKDAGISRRVIRVRGCAREMSRSSRLHPTSEPPNDESIRVPDFTFGFLKQARLAQDKQVRRSSEDAPSLDEAAWERFETSRDSHKSLSKLLEKLDGGATKTKRTASELRNLVSKLYFLVIREADFIATTPVGASGQLSTMFHPDLVFVDEAAHARELTSLMPLAFNPARAYIFTGDTRQTRPFVQGCQGKGLRFNQYAKQLMISTMERADLAGALDSKLLITHRMYGDLHVLASELFYDGLLKSGMTPTGRFPDSVQHIQHWLSRFSHGQGCVVPRLLIDHHESREQKDRTSFYNPVHEAFIKERCLELLCDADFRRVDKPDQPGRILIITPYKAALKRYKTFTDVLPPHFRGRLDVELRHKSMEARTVDSAQGHEADFVFVDTVRTKTAGFLDDPKRLCVMLTRARIGEMVLMNKGMTMKRHSGSMIEAEWTAKVYEHCQKNGQLVNINRWGSELIEATCCLGSENGIGLLPA